MPDDDPLPPPIDIGAERARSARCTSRYRCGVRANPRSNRAAETDGLVRHDIRELQARDATAGGGDVALVEVAALRTRLLLASDVTAGVCDAAARTHRRMPGRQAGRARRQVHPDGAARRARRAGWPR